MLAVQRGPDDHDQSVETNQSVETPEDTAAYQEGYADGQGGAASDPIGRVGFQYAQDYLSGYAAGQAAPAPARLAQDERAALRAMPSIGPASEHEGPGGRAKRSRSPMSCPPTRAPTGISTLS
jgi:hypothetical protein